MKRLNILIVFSIFIFEGCSNSMNNEQTNNNELSSSHVHEEDVQISLNNGEKWVVDTNMMQHIRAMEFLIENFEQSQDLNNYESLANDLQKGVQLLTSNCTMKGQAHDELHLWLVPYIDLVDSLSEANDMNAAQKQFSELKKSFKLFNTYFN
jgi:PBP1b-binding outer membrane lipoprotein LpoB